MGLNDPLKLGWNNSPLKSGQNNLTKREQDWKVRMGIGPKCPVTSCVLLLGTVFHPDPFSSGRLNLWGKHIRMLCQKLGHHRIFFIIFLGQKKNYSQHIFWPVSGEIGKNTSLRPYFLFLFNLVIGKKTNLVTHEIIRTRHTSQQMGQNLFWGRKRFWTKAVYALSLFRWHANWPRQYIRRRYVDEHINLSDGLFNCTGHLTALILRNPAITVLRRTQEAIIGPKISRMRNCVTWRLAV